MTCGEIVACPLVEIYKRQADRCLSRTEAALVMGMDGLASVVLVFYEFLDILKPSEQEVSLIKPHTGCGSFKGPLSYFFFVTVILQCHSKKGFCRLWWQENPNSKKKVGDNFNYSSPWKW